MCSGCKMASDSGAAWPLLVSFQEMAAGLEGEVGVVAAAHRRRNTAVVEVEVEGRHRPDRVSMSMSILCDEDEVVCVNSRHSPHYWAQLGYAWVGVVYDTHPF